MKKVICLILVLIIGSSLIVNAQANLFINSIFDGRYRDSPNATETIVSGKKMQLLTLYHSLTLKDDASGAKFIEGLVLKDGTSAIDKEVVYKEGKLNYGFFTFKPFGKMNRYLFFLNETGKDKVVVIYMEGSATMEDIKRMIKK